MSVAQSFGAQVCDLSQGHDAVDAAMLLSGGVGVDAVVIAAASKSSEYSGQVNRRSYCFGWGCRARAFAAAVFEKPASSFMLVRTRTI